VTGELVAALEALGFSVFRRGALADDGPLPPTFVTVWGDDSRDAAHYDNAPHALVSEYSVYYYTSLGPARMEADVDRLVAGLRAAGYQVDGRGFDAAADESEHLARGLRARMTERRMT